MRLSNEFNSCENIYMDAMTNDNSVIRTVKLTVYSYIQYVALHTVQIYEYVVLLSIMLNKIVDGMSRLKPQCSNFRETGLSTIEHTLRPQSLARASQRLRNKYNRIRIKKVKYLIIIHK